MLGTVVKRGIVVLWVSDFAITDETGTREARALQCDFMVRACGVCGPWGPSCKSGLDQGFSEHVAECYSSWAHFRGSLDGMVVTGARWPLSASYFLISTALLWSVSYTELELLVRFRLINSVLRSEKSLQTAGSEDWLLVKTNTERSLFSRASNDYISGIHIDQSADIWKQRKAKN